jgi:tetratricopeptide (TPR) repeat protein
VTLFAYLAMLGWIPCVIVMFAMLPTRQAAAAGVIGAWLFLPPYTLPIVGLPDFSKITASSVGLLAATLIFSADSLFKFRPRWFDLPMVLWCFSGMFASLANDLGFYDGISTTLGQTLTWGLPYLFGRIYFGDPDGLRYFATAIVIGGLCCVLPCVYEMRMSPQLLANIYGYGGSGAVARLGGWRPNLFFTTGLELGMWMTAVALTGWWLWRCGAIKRIGQLPFGQVLLPILMATTVICRSTGALALLFAGMGLLWASVRFRTRVLLIALLLAGPLYVSVRATNLWSGQQAVAVAEMVAGADRAESLEYRFSCENLLAARALEQPIFGWGGWARSNVYFFENTSYRKMVPTDGLWIIILGTSGFVGLVLFYVVMILPAVRFVWRCPPRHWGDPQLATCTLVSVFMALYMVDCLLNAFPNMIYVTLAGGLMSIEPNRLRATARRQGGSAPAPRAKVSGHHPQKAALGAIPATLTPLAGCIMQAERYVGLGRSLKQERRFDEAESAWRAALDSLTRALEAQPDSPELRLCWCECANDLAWLRANHPDLARRDPDAAVAMARQIVETFPDAEVYWNTLGVAYYRAGDNASSVAALDRAMALGGGTAFDDVFLAMAHARQGDFENAQRELDRATANAKRDYPGHTELAHFCDEAQSLLSERSGSPNGAL